MKFRVLLAALYILFMALMPCQDSHGSASDPDSIVQADHEHNSEEADMCTPFCICHCCGGALVNTLSTFSVFIPQVWLEKPQPNYLANLNTGIKPGIWQPPQAA